MLQKLINGQEVLMKTDKKVKIPLFFFIFVHYFSTNDKWIYEDIRKVFQY